VIFEFIFNFVMNSGKFHEKPTPDFLYFIHQFMLRFAGDLSSERTNT